jgi:hypothetical protein
MFADYSTNQLTIYDVHGNQYHVRKCCSHIEDTIYFGYNYQWVENGKLMVGITSTLDPDEHLDFELEECDYCKKKIILYQIQGE